VVRAITTDKEILATRDVMRQLRPAIPADAYLDTVRRMMRTDDYHLAAAFDGETVRAVAGYRFMEMLWAGRILYVDDLNTDEAFRSQGHGKAVLNWLKHEAKTRDCRALHLDSGVQREQAHRFYFREGLTINAYHFQTPL
jgi:GNAT superfamily N-acetyltransferase